MMKNLAKVVVLACMLVPVACLSACGKRCGETEHHHHHKLEKMKQQQGGK